MNQLTLRLPEGEQLKLRFRQDGSLKIWSFNIKGYGARKLLSLSKNNAKKLEKFMAERRGK